MLALEEMGAFAALLGPVTHLTWFIRGEHDLLARQYVVFGVGLQALGFFVLTKMAEVSATEAIAAVATMTAAYLTTLFTSIVIYRLFFHKLSKYPGPLSWRITKLAQAYKNLDYGGYRHLDELHQKYGPIVRTGPNELSVVDPRAFHMLQGPGTKCRKPVWYEMHKPMTSVHHVRDKKLHEVRRKIWDQGFSARSLRGYEPRVTKYVNQLMDQMESQGARFNASKWLNYFSFDVMGELAFGESFGMLETGEVHFALKLLSKGMSYLNFGPSVPWLFYLYSRVPYLSRGFHNFANWSNEKAEERKKMKFSEPDIMTYLFNAGPMSNDPAVNAGWQQGDARLIIVAGSGTTASGLVLSFLELIKHPEVADKLREEVAPFVNGREVDYLGLSKCAFLNACIDEALRLHPPVPGGLIRETPEFGLKIGDNFIPGNTNVVAPTHTNQRSPAAYIRPDDYIPERWTTQPELVKVKGVFAPFSAGAHACVGRHLAYMEMRAVLSRMVTQFDLSFAEGEDGSNVVNKSKNHFGKSLADMWVTLTPREKA